MSGPYSVMEDSLQGVQHRISILIHDVFPSSSARFPEIDKRLADFIDIVTGGDFRSPHRQKDAERSLAGQLRATELILAVRKARRKYSPYPAALNYKIRLVTKMIKIHLTGTLMKIKRFILPPDNQ